MVGHLVAAEAMREQRALNLQPVDVSFQSVMIVMWSVGHLKPTSWVVSIKFKVIIFQPSNQNFF